jgi:hydroxymethylbilane synthase
VGALRLRIGARSSRLSQAQTEIVSNLLIKRVGEGLALEFIRVKTRGYRASSGATGSQIEGGAKRAFTGDIEALLLGGEIDVAIHSMKDLPSDPTEGLTIGAIPPRGDPRDALIADLGQTMKTLRKGAKVGTSSLRRKAQLLRIRQDLSVVELHGNVDTRLRKVGGGNNDLDAIVLAVAGLERIGERTRISQTFSIDEMVPAVGQGIIAVQIRRDDRDVAKVLSHIDDGATLLESECERAFARRISADCNVPVGGCARVSGGTIRIIGVMAEQDGSELRQKALDGPSSEAVALGRRLADDLLGGAPKRRGAAS